MSEDLGSAHGSVTINAASALATLAALRRSSAATVGTLNTVGRASITAGLATAGVGAAIAGVFALAVSKSAEIEKKISYITAITGVHGKEVDVVREKIIQLGQDSAYTASEVADGFTELSKAGATTKQLVGGVGDAMITLGQSADIGLADAATALISISSTFNLLPKDAAHIADVMQGAANASIISVEDMAVSFKYAGGVAANLGLTVDETATAIALLGNAGIKGSTAGTSLRRIFLQLTPRTKEAAAEMKELGIITKDGSNRFYDAQGNAKKLSDITEILRQSTKKLTPEMKQKALATIFGDRAINSAIALSKGGSKAFNAMGDSIAKVKAADVAKKRLDNLSGAWEILKGTIDSALIRAGAPAQKPLMEIVRLVTRLVNAFNKLSPGTQAMIVRFLLWTSAILLLVGGMLIVIGTIFRAAAVIMQLVNVIKIVMMQVRLFIAVWQAANGAFLLSPIGLIILAVIALAVAIFILWKRSETFRTAVKAIGSVLANIGKAIWAFLQQIPGAVKDAWDATKNFFVGLYNAVAGFITSAVNVIKNNWKLLPLIFLGPFGLIIALFIKFHDQIMGVVGRLVSGVVNFFAQLPGRIGYALGFILGLLVRAVIAWNMLLFNGARRAVNAVVNFFKNLPGRLAGILARVIAFIVAWVPRLIGLAIRAGQGFVRGVINFWKNLPSLAWGILQRVIGFVTTMHSRVINLASRIGHGFVNGIVNVISGLPGLVSGIVGRTISAFKSMVKGAFEAAKSFASGLWNGFKKGLGINSPSFIEKQMVQITDVTGQETDNLRKQVRTLRRVGGSLPAVDTSKSLAGLPTGSLRRRDGSPLVTQGGDRYMTVNVNQPGRLEVGRSYDRALKETAYANGWTK